MSTSISSTRQSISQSSRASNSERSVSSEVIDGKSSYSDEDSVELTSTIKTPRLKTKTPEALNSREFFNRTSTPDRSADRSGSNHVSTESNRSGEAVASQETQAPIILAASEPRIEARIYGFILIASTLTAMSSPFVMILAPNDLAIKASLFSVAAASGLIAGAAYCYGDYMLDLRKQVQSQQRSEVSPA